MDTVARRKSASRARDSGSYSGLQFTVLVASLALVLGCASADDRLRCCMRGIKRMKTIELCPAPCCIGYHEEVSNPPNLGPMVWCEKNEDIEVEETPRNTMFNPLLFRLNQARSGRR